MATKGTTLTTDYIVNGSDQLVTLELIIGAPGQTAKTVLKVDGNSPKQSTNGDLPASFSGGLNETKIDTNKNLSGKILEISTDVTDTSKETNHTELIVRLRGGKYGFTEYPLVLVVDNDGDDAMYKVTIKFTKSLNS